MRIFNCLVRPECLHVEKGDVFFGRLSVDCFSMDMKGLVMRKGDVVTVTLENKGNGIVELDLYKEDG
jgi:hypothetical protein